jgi:hypothetical protein
MTANNGITPDDALSLIEEALRESKTMLEIYAKPADSAAWAAIQKSHRAIIAVLGLREVGGLSLGNTENTAG